MTTTFRASLAFVLPALAALPFASCTCDSDLHSLPQPKAVLSFDDQAAPPKDLVDVAGPAVALGQNADTVFVLKNEGNAPLEVASLTLGGDDELCPQPSAAFFLVGGGGAFEVKGGEKHDIAVRFAPTTAAPSCTVLTVNSNDPDHKTLLGRLQQQGDAPQLCADRAVVDFGDVTVGDHVDDTVVLTSCGTKPITLQSATLNASFTEPFEATPPSLPTTLAVGDTIELPVAFDPDEAGQWSIGAGAGTVTFVDDLGASYDVTLIGSAHEPPRCHIQIVPETVNMGQVAIGTVGEQDVIVRNIGALPCTFTSADIVGGDPFSRELVSLTAGQTLDPQASGIVSVSFSPITAQGQQTDTLRVISDDPVSPTIDVPLQGNSVDVLPCQLQAVPTALNFGAQTLHHSNTRTVSMENIGTEMCMITDIHMISGAPDFSIVVPTLGNICDQVPPQFCDLFGDLFGTMVGPGDHVDFVVNFRPNTSGPHTGDVQFTYHEQTQPGAQNPDQLIDLPLSGTGTAPCLTVSPQDVDFGDLGVGETGSHDVLVTNCGSGELSLRGLSIRSSSDPGFGSAPQAPTTLPVNLAAGAGQIVHVTATPQNGGAMFGALDVLSDAGATGVQLRANTPACTNGIVCHPADELDFGTVLTGEAQQRTVICMNPTGHDIAIDPTIGAPFAVASAPTSIPAGGDAVVRVGFTPVNAGTETDVLDMGAASCEGGPVRIDVHAVVNDDVLPPCPAPESFTPVEAWRWSGEGASPASKMSWSTPLVSRLEDTNGDGVVTREDMPRVIMTTFDAADMAALLANPASGGNDPIPAFVRALDGATGAEVWTSPDNDEMKVQSESSLALADLDGDGKVEIVGQKYLVLPGAGTTDPNNPANVGASSIFGKFAHGFLIAFNFDGTFKWQSDEWERGTNDGEDGGAPAIGDVDGDGFAEIVWADTLFDHNGHILWSGDHTFTASTGHGSLPVLADVDGNPGLEVIVGPRVFRADGSILWERTDLADGHPAVADLDGDGNNEIVIRNDKLTILNGQTGATLHQTAAGSGIPTNVAIMDVDGDGQLEIASAASPVLSVFDNTLHEVFRSSITDQSGASGPAGFDFEGDGSQSVVYADENSLFAYDSEGRTVFQGDRLSATIFEYATVADVDNDGHADMLVVDNANLPSSTVGGLRCYQNAGTSWAQARGMWSQHAYVEAIISEFGTPLFESNPTPIPGFRAARARCE